MYPSVHPFISPFKTWHNKLSSYKNITRNRFYCGTETGQVDHWLFLFFQTLISHSFLFLFFHVTSFLAIGLEVSFVFWSTRPTHIVTAGSDNCFCTCRPSVPTFQNKTNIKRKQCSLLARLWVWPSGSLSFLIFPRNFISSHWSWSFLRDFKLKA